MYTMTAREQLTYLGGYIRTGFIINLKVKKGQPVLKPPPRIIRHIVLNPKHAEKSILDLRHRDGYSKLFELMATMENGQVSIIEFKEGFPCLMEVGNGNRSPVPNILSKL